MGTTPNPIEGFPALSLRLFEPWEYIIRRH
jgi:hypothetical protein